VKTQTQKRIINDTHPKQEGDAGKAASRRNIAHFDQLEPGSCPQNAAIQNRKAEIELKQKTENKSNVSYGAATIFSLFLYVDHVVFACKQRVIRWYWW
jgi:hypothetical protein